MWKAVIAVWISTTLLIGVVIYCTQDMRCLWFLLIPALMRFRGENTEKYNGKEEDEVD